MEARYELQRFTIGGVRLLLAVVALVLVAGASGYGLRALTFRIPVNTPAPATTSGTAPSYDDWWRDVSSQRAAQTVIPVNTPAPATTSGTAPSYDDWWHDVSSQRAAQTVPDDSRVPQTSPVPVHEGR